MKDATALDNTTDDIDIIVDALMRNPENADDIKSLLRQKLREPNKLRVLAADKRSKAEPASDPDEFWDNFPV